MSSWAGDTVTTMHSAPTIWTTQCASDRSWPMAAVTGGRKLCGGHKSHGGLTPDRVFMHCARCRLSVSQ